MRIVEGFQLRELLDETIAVPGGPAASRLSGLISLNETGVFLFRLLQTQQTRQSLEQALLANYDTTPAQAQADVEAFLKGLRQTGILLEEE